MYYPFLLYGENIRHAPVFQGLAGDPYVADLSRRNPALESADGRDQRAFQRQLEAKMRRGGHSWGLAPYLEPRDTLLSACPQMVSEQRFIHLGLDVIVALGTALHAPLDAQVADRGYEAGEGNYGNWVLLRHAGPGFAPFYSLYGHLAEAGLTEKDRTLTAGETFAAIGDFSENGNWFHHTHIQVITELGLERGYLSKGYCARADLAEINDLCPSPVPLFKAR